MKNILLAFCCILATYNLYAMEPLNKQAMQDQLIQDHTAEDERQADIRDRALWAAAQNGYLDPEFLGPQFCQNFTILTLKRFGASKDIKPCIQKECGTNCVFSPCGRFYAFSKFNTIFTQNIHTGLVLKTTTTHILGFPHSLIFSPDGSFLYALYISINLDQNATVLQIDIDKKQVEDFSCERGVWFDFKKFNPHAILYKFNEPIWHSKKIYSSHFDEREVSYPKTISPDGTLLVFKETRSFSPTIIIWNVIDKRIVKKLERHFNDSIKKIMFSDTGNLLVAITKNHAYIWETKKWGLMSIIKIATAEKIHLSINSDDKIIAISNEMGINIYDIKTGNLLQAIPHELKSPSHKFLLSEIKKNGPIHTLAFNHYGQLSTYTHDSIMRVWDMIPLKARIAFRSLSIKQLLILMSLIKPLASGRVIHLTPGSPSWNLVNTMPEEIKTLLAPCLEHKGIVTTLLNTVRDHAALIAASIF